MRIFLLALLLTSVPFTLLATSSGITRRSTTNSGGCGPGGCHAFSASSLTTLSIAEITGGLTVARGQKVRLTLVVRNASRTAVGVNLSVKTALNGNTNAGTFTAVAGEGLRVTAGEMTHNSAKPLTSGETRFAFDWTAPNTDGTVFLHACANAVNGNGSPDANDIWNFLEPIEIVVSGTNSVNEERASSGLTIAPQPAHGDVTVSVENVPNGEYTLNIFNGNGAIVGMEKFTVVNSLINRVVPMRDVDGNSLPTGHYPFNIVGAKAVFRGTFYFVR